MQKTAETRALYNGDCPVCHSEICAYSEYSEKRGLPIAFDDLNRTDLEKWGVTEDEAARLLHVIHRGKLYVGADAFLVLWEQMPRYRLLSHIGRLPGIYHLASWSYSQIVARAIYARHKRRQARKCTLTNQKSPPKGRAFRSP